MGRISYRLGYKIDISIPRIKFKKAGSDVLSIRLFYSIGDTRWLLRILLLGHSKGKGIDKFEDVVVGIKTWWTAQTRKNVHDNKNYGRRYVFVKLLLL